MLCNTILIVVSLASAGEPSETIKLYAQDEIYFQPTENKNGTTKSTGKAVTIPAGEEVELHIEGPKIFLKNKSGQVSESPMVYTRELDLAPPSPDTTREDFDRVMKKYKRKVVKTNASEIVSKIKAMKGKWLHFKITMLDIPYTKESKKGSTRMISSDRMSRKRLKDNIKGFGWAIFKGSELPFVDLIREKDAWVEMLVQIKGVAEEDPDTMPVLEILAYSTEAKTQINTGGIEDCFQEYVPRYFANITMVQRHYNHYEAARFFKHISNEHSQKIRLCKRLPDAIQPKYSRKELIKLLATIQSLNNVISECIKSIVYISEGKKSSARKATKYVLSSVPRISKSLKRISKMTRKNLKIPASVDWLNKYRVE